MFGKPGPFQVIENDGDGDVENPIAAPRRRYSCDHYQTCLDLACALNWDNFTCRGCSGNVDRTLLWRAQSAQKKDGVARKLCHLPGLSPTKAKIISLGDAFRNSKRIAKLKEDSETSETTLSDQITE